MSDPTSPPRWSLRDLQLAPKLCIACFLVSVGIGYFSAIVQLHFKHATPGSLLPSFKDVVRTFHGHVGAEPKSRLEKLLTASEGLPFNGSGQMRTAFTTRSSEPNWKKAVDARAKELAGRREAGRVAEGPAEPNDQDREAAEEQLRAEREGEINTLVAWINAGAPEEAYKKNEFRLPDELKGHPITKEFALADGPGGHLEDILKLRCARCHNKEAPEEANAGNYPLESYADYKKYLKVEKATAMSVEKLAQTTHIHLLSFSMLYFLTGILFAMTRYPALIRVPLAATPLVAQFADVSCWWLARLEGDIGVRFAETIPLTGAVVGLGLGLQIVLTIFDMFKARGRVVFVLLALAAGCGFYVVKTNVIDPHIAAERAAMDVKQ